jgi:hypothetical protein
MKASAGRAVIGGPNQVAIISAVANGCTTPLEIRRFIGARVGGPQVERSLANLCKRGALQLRDGVYRVTSRGRELLGPGGCIGEMAPLKPQPRPPMRPGADVAARLPSMSAGRLWERRCQPE